MPQPSRDQIYTRAAREAAAILHETRDEIDSRSLFNSIHRPRQIKFFSFVKWLQRQDDLLYRNNIKPAVWRCACDECLPQITRGEAAAYRIRA